MHKNTHLFLLILTIVSCMIYAGCIREYGVYGDAPTDAQFDDFAVQHNDFDAVIRTTSINKDTNPHLNIRISPTTGEFFGQHLAALGDWDGPDGPIAHVLAASNTTDPGPRGDGSHWGSIYILFLSVDGSVLKHTIIDGDTPNIPPALQQGYPNFGFGLTSLGDLDGDGPSVAVLATGALWHDASRGGVFLFYLLPDGSILHSVTIDAYTKNGPQLGVDHFFGRSLASLGDLDGPGAAAHVLAVGAPYDIFGAREDAPVGSVFLFYLLSDGSILRHIEITAGTPGMPSGHPHFLDKFGNALAWLPYTQHNPPSDGGILAIGAPLSNHDNMHGGGVYLVRLLPDGSIWSATIIDHTALNISPSIIRFGEYLSNFSSLASIPRNGASYTLMISGMDEDNSRSPRFVTTHHILYLNEDLSILGAYGIDGHFSHGIPYPSYSEGQYDGSAVNLGALNPRTPHEQTIAFSGYYSTHSHNGGSIYMHTINTQ